MRKSFILFLLCIFTLPVMAKETILIIGDSLSAGQGILTQKGWVALLQDRLNDQKYNYQVINASISGDTTSDGLARMPKILQQYRPHITIIELGGNDGLRGLQITEIENNLERMIDLALKAKSKVLLIGLRMPPNYGPLYTERFQKIYIDLAKKKNISSVSLFLEGVDDKLELMQPDGIHPREEAQIILLNNVWSPLEKLIKDKS